MRPLIAGLAIAALSLCAAASFAQQQRRYEVDPKTKWAVGAKQTPADELKKQLDAGAVMIIDVRPPANFEKETIPGAINVPLEQLEGYLKKHIQGHLHRLHVRDRSIKLAGCEASRRPRIHEHDILSRQQVERTRLPSRTRQEKMIRKKPFGPADY